MKLTKEVVAAIKSYIIDNVRSFPNTLTNNVVEYFEITKPTVLKYINELIEEGVLVKKGQGRSPKYALKVKVNKFQYTINEKIAEDVIWREDIYPILDPLSQNVLLACNYGLTEMVNNVIDHSEAKNFYIEIKQDCLTITFIISDSGIGIFKKIQKVLELDDPKHSILELAKGKFTSDPNNHTGEGVFFTSKIFNEFIIISYNLSFIGNPNLEVLFQDVGEEIEGTTVMMMIQKQSNIAIADVFNEYTNPDKEPGFHKTIVPVKLMQYEGEALLSRSQAKRLIQRFDKFLEVVLDFEGVNIIGQAFADEVFRVFQNEHPNVHLTPANTTTEIKNMIIRASKH
ncbi:MAG: DUF4325 domain-containing protein [Desulfobacteraceae bacterium]|nr:MAG: DUF4325 domain-containing protein [Desulfobacteraceae bacterium]